MGTHVHQWRIHVNVWQNQYSIVKQNKVNIKKNNNKCAGWVRTPGLEGQAGRGAEPLQKPEEILLPGCKGVFIQPRGLTLNSTCAASHVPAVVQASSPHPAPEAGLNSLTKPSSSPPHTGFRQTVKAHHEKQGLFMKTWKTSSHLLFTHSFKNMSKFYTLCQALTSRQPGFSNWL